MPDITPISGFPIQRGSRAALDLSDYEDFTRNLFFTLDKDLTEPPSSPVNNASYIVGASATGAWSGYDDYIALFIQRTWQFFPPRDGLFAWVDDEDSLYHYFSGAWSKFTGSGGASYPLNGAVTALTGGTLSGNVIQDYEIKVATASSSSGVLTLNYNAGPVFSVTMTENITSTSVTNAPDAGNLGKITLLLSQDGTGGWSFAHPGSVSWGGAGAPTLTTTASTTSILSYLSRDSFSTNFGLHAGTGFT